MLEADLADTEGGSLHGQFAIRPFGAGTAASAVELSAREREILALVGDRPKPLRKIAVSSGAQRALTSLKRKGLVQIVRLHARRMPPMCWICRPTGRGRRRLWRPGSWCAFATCGQPTMKRTHQFCREVWSETVRLTCRVILEMALGQTLGQRRNPGSGVLGQGRTRPGEIADFAVDPGGGGGRPGQGLLRRGGAAARLRSRVSVILRCRQCGGRRNRRGRADRDGDDRGRRQRPVPRARPEGASASSPAAPRRLPPPRNWRGRQRLQPPRPWGPRRRKSASVSKKHHLPDAVDDNGLLEAVVRAEAIGRPGARP